MAARLLFSTRPPLAVPGDNPFDVLDPGTTHEGDEEMAEEPLESPRTPQANTPRTRQPATPEPTDRGSQCEEEEEGGGA